MTRHPLSLADPPSLPPSCNSTCEGNSSRTCRREIHRRKTRTGRSRWSLSVGGLPLSVVCCAPSTGAEWLIHRFPPKSNPQRDAWATWLERHEKSVQNRQGMTHVEVTQQTYNPAQAQKKKMYMAEICRNAPPAERLLVSRPVLCIASKPGFGWDKYLCGSSMQLYGPIPCKTGLQTLQNKGFKCTGQVAFKSTYKWF